MSVVPIWCKTPYRDQTPQIQRSTRHSERGFMPLTTSLQAGTVSEHRRRSFSGFDSKATMQHYSSEPEASERQLKSLSSYFGKLQNAKSSNSSDPSSKELKILDSYLDKLDKDRATSSSFDKIPIGESKAIEETKTSNTNPRSKAGLNSPKSSQRPEDEDDEASDLYLVSVLASINIAVILFETASPVRSSEAELSTLPLLYGAKVNHLIMTGEWWRLVTPMFLHWGVFHIALSCWSLLTFGPKVCRGYGWFTFLLIYVLGGVSGNLISFLHTPDPTVGGTGPVYAIIGAWLIYQLQNKDVIAKHVSEKMFQKAIVATGIGLILSHFCPIDEWSHFGSVFTGVAFGLVTCPTVQLGESGGDEGIAVVKRQGSPCKSLLLFSVFIIVLCSLFLLVDPPINDLLFESFLQY